MSSTLLTLIVIPAIYAVVKGSGDPIAALDGIFTADVSLRRSAMMHDMTNMMHGMGWAMGLIWLLAVLVLVLGVAALVKYVLSYYHPSKWHLHSAANHKR